MGFTNGTNIKINVRSEKLNSKVKNVHPAKFCFSLFAILIYAVARSFLSTIDRKR